MVRHVILWQLKDEYTPAEKTSIAAGIKEGLEGLVGVVPGLVSARVEINPLPSASCDVMLDSVLESPETLAAYRDHPAHVAVANSRVRPFVRTRLCMDVEQS